jgi:hypothetical protein
VTDEVMDVFVVVASEVDGVTAAFSEGGIVLQRRSGAASMSGAVSGERAVAAMLDPSDVARRPEAPVGQMVRPHWDS